MKPELFLADLKVAARSLWRSKGLSITVILTLALGIGANAAIFSLVRGVLLRPLINRDENRIIYIRQSAKGIDADNTNFSVPEIRRPQRQYQIHRTNSAISRSSVSPWSASASRAKSAAVLSAAAISMSWAFIPRSAASSTCAMTAPTPLASQSSPIASGSPPFKKDP